MIASAPQKPLSGTFLDEFKSCLEDHIALLPAYYRWSSPDWEKSPAIERRMKDALRDAQEFFGKLSKDLAGETALNSNKLEDYFSHAGEGTAMQNMCRSVMQDYEALSILQNQGNKFLQEWVMQHLDAHVPAFDDSTNIGSLLFNQAHIQMCENRGDQYSPLAYKYFVEGIQATQGQAQMVKEEFFCEYADTPKGRLEAQMEYEAALYRNIKDLGLSAYLSDTKRARA